MGRNRTTMSDCDKIMYIDYLRNMFARFQLNHPQNMGVRVPKFGVQGRTCPILPNILATCLFFFWQRLSHINYRPRMIDSTTQQLVSRSALLLLLLLLSLLLVHAAYAVVTVGWLVTRVDCGHTAGCITFIFGTLVGIGHINIVLVEHPNRLQIGELGAQSFGFNGKL